MIQSVLTKSGCLPTECLHLDTSVDSIEHLSRDGADTAPGYKYKLTYTHHDNGEESSGSDNVASSDGVGGSKTHSGLGDAPTTSPSTVVEHFDAVVIAARYPPVPWILLDSPIRYLRRSRQN
jgi:hypothetical protein